MKLNKKLIQVLMIGMIMLILVPTFSLQVSSVGYDSPYEASDFANSLVMDITVTYTSASSKVEQVDTIQMSIDMVNIDGVLVPQSTEGEVSQAYIGPNDQDAEEDYWKFGDLVRGRVNQFYNTTSSLGEDADFYYSPTPFNHSAAPLFEIDGLAPRNGGVVSTIVATWFTSATAPTAFNTTYCINSTIFSQELSGWQTFSQRYDAYNSTMTYLHRLYITNGESDGVWIWDASNEIYTHGDTLFYFGSLDATGYNGSTSLSTNSDLDDTNRTIWAEHIFDNPNPTGSEYANNIAFGWVDLDDLIEAKMVEEIKNLDEISEINYYDITTMYHKLTVPSSLQEDVVEYIDEAIKEGRGKRLAALRAGVPSDELTTQGLFSWISNGVLNIRNRIFSGYSFVVDGDTNKESITEGGSKGALGGLMGILSGLVGGATTIFTAIPSTIIDYISNGGAYDCYSGILGLPARIISTITKFLMFGIAAIIIIVVFMVFRLGKRKERGKQKGQFSKYDKGRYDY